MVKRHLPDQASPLVNNCALIIHLALMYLDRTKHDDQELVQLLVAIRALASSLRQTALFWKFKSEVAGSNELFDIRKRLEEMATLCGPMLEELTTVVDNVLSATARKGPKAAATDMPDLQLFTEGLRSHGSLAMVTNDLVPIFWGSSDPNLTESNDAILILIQTLESQAMNQAEPTTECIMRLLQSIQRYTDTILDIASPGNASTPSTEGRNGVKADTLLPRLAYLEDRVYREKFPLMYAAGMGELGEAQNHLDKGVEINSRDNKNRTPLMYAVIGGHLNVAELLMQQGAKATASDAIGKRPLVYAVEVGSVPLVNLLLGYRGYMGPEPLGVREAREDAEIYGFQEIVEILKPLDKSQFDFMMDEASIIV